MNENNIEMKEEEEEIEDLTEDDVETMNKFLNPMDDPTFKDAIDALGETLEKLTKGSDALAGTHAPSIDSRVVATINYLHTKGKLTTNAANKIQRQYETCVDYIEQHQPPKVMFDRLPKPTIEGRILYFDSGAKQSAFIAGKDEMQKSVFGPVLEFTRRARAASRTSAK